MLSDAIKITIKAENISTSFLQRQLGCGYNKAAELIGKMTDMGILAECDHRGHRAIDRPAGRAALENQDD